MIEILHEMRRYGDCFAEVLCCDCFYDEVYFLLRQKVNDRIFEERFQKYDDCFITLFDGVIIVVCADIISFLRDNKHELSRKKCIKDVIWCLKNRIGFCSICTVELFKRINMLHLFKLKC